jgi:lipoate-protein ligase B
LQVKQLLVLDTGLTPYDTAWALQRSAANARINGSLESDLLIMCEHPPVVTLGRSTKAGNLLSTPEYLAAHGIELREVERGGDITVHEPGQLVCYPIIDLKQHRKDLHWYLRQLEQVIIDAIQSFDIEATRIAGLTGVWIENRKIASIGVHARDWVTWHGLALNVDNTLDTFSHIVPCGINHVTMTTLNRERAQKNLAPIQSADVRRAIVSAFGNQFGLTVTAAPSDLESSFLAHQIEQAH